MSGLHISAWDLIDPCLKKCHPIKCRSNSHGVDVHHVKLIDAKLFMKFPPFMEHQGLLPLNKVTTGLNFESAEFTPYPQILLL
jgi:hypothetical protein